MPRPICFMIMPYGTRPTMTEGGKGPDKIDFNSLWEKALQPLIEKDLNHTAVRADQDLGALIIQEMIERLALADLVIADVTIPNGNVYYEVGVRHAAKEHGCVMIAANWAKQLFDIDQMRRVVYPLAETVVTDAGASAIRDALKNAVPLLAGGLSPVYQALPGYPTKVDATRATSFAAQMAEMSDFQAEVQTARGAPRGERKDRALALHRKYAATPLHPALALELLMLLRDTECHKEALASIAEFPAAMQQLSLVKEQRCLIQSSSGNVLEAAAALEELIRVSGETSERRGLLGGRYKKLYNTSKDEVEKRRYLDRAIKEYDRGMRLDLNDYYPSCNLPRLLRLRGKPGDEERARAAAGVVLIACDRARERNASDPWLNPTLLGAAFDAGDVRRACELHDEIAEQGPDAFHLKTTIADLELSINLLKDPGQAEGLGQVLADLKKLLPPTLPAP